ncbi:squalene/phytoene synthase family protein [Streptomyces sp. FR-108]|uniref:squalene/phytoene synthase family protein n=1 Tax=Streptomyces sp. FR-108 TaxID=3416665 RepID=UPI003CE74351
MSTFTFPPPSHPPCPRPAPATCLPTKPRHNPARSAPLRRHPKPHPAPASLDNPPAHRRAPRQQQNQPPQHQARTAARHPLATRRNQSHQITSAQRTAQPADRPACAVANRHDDTKIPSEGRAVTNQQLSEAHAVVRAHSTTWYEPIKSMPPRLNEACTGTYLMLRAIDEIEDHRTLLAADRATLLRNVSISLQTQQDTDPFGVLMGEHGGTLPDVTHGLPQWTALIPSDIAPRVCEAIAAMADRMADWVLKDFHIDNRKDLDRYTYAVGSATVLIFCDLWSWYDGTRSHRTHGIAFGRFLQAVNILIDRDEDAQRGVDFLPTNWHLGQMITYAHDQVNDAASYVEALAPGPARDFFTGPYRRARKALQHLSHSTG